MNQFDRVLLKVFLCLSPINVGLIVLDSFYPLRNLGKFNSVLNAGFGIILVVWILSMFYVSVKLLASNRYRGAILSRLLFLKERDEREVHVSGRATRNSFLATLAILLFFLCVSLFKISIYEVPEDQAVNGNRGTLSIQLNTQLLGEKVKAPPGEDRVFKSYFVYPGLPLSNTAVILFLVLWQIASYNYFFRRIETGKESLAEKM